MILIARLSVLLFNSLNTYWFYMILVKILQVARGVRAGIVTSDKDE